MKDTRQERSLCSDAFTHSFGLSLLNSQALTGAQGDLWKGSMQCLFTSKPLANPLFPEGPGKCLLQAGECGIILGYFPFSFFFLSHGSAIRPGHSRNFNAAGMEQQWIGSLNPKMHNLSGWGDLGKGSCVPKSVWEIPVSFPFLLLPLCDIGIDHGEKCNSRGCLGIRGPREQERSGKTEKEARESDTLTLHPHIEHVRKTPKETQQSLRKRMMV